MKGSPHSGQNLGGFSASAGVQPHLSHLYFLGAAGLALPQLGQNLPSFVAPHEQVQLVDTVAGAAGASLLAPQLAQNFVRFCAPHEQVQGSGFLVPQDAQNAPVLVAPQAHFQPFTAGLGGTGVVC